jgi:hypothetical protein
LRKWVRPLLNGVTLLALTLLAIIVFLHIYYVDRQVEASTDHIIALFADSQIQREMGALQTKISRSLVLFSGRPAREPIKVRLAYEARYLTGISRADTLESCERLVASGSPSVTYQCAGLVLPPRASRTEIDAALQLAGNLDLGDSLRALYLHAKDATSITNSKQRSRPVVESVYALVSIHGEEFAVIYPGGTVEPDFDFRSRPWYRPSRHLEKVDATEIYHDYSSDDFIVSLVPKAFPPATARVVADYLVQPSSGTGLDLYLLNALLAIVALSGYIRFYVRSHRKYQKYLVLSTACLLAAYVALVVNQVLTASQGPHLSDRQLIIDILSFLPAGSLLVAAGRALSGSQPRAWITTLQWYPFEFLAGALDHWSKNLYWGALFSCICLCIFAWNLRKVGKSYASEAYADLSPSPYSSASYGSAAFVLWGLAQFGLVFLARESSAVWRLISPLAAGRGWTDLLLSSVGGFIILLYAKGVAVFFTTLFLYSQELDALRRSFDDSEPVPWVHLDASGIVVGRSDDFPPDFDQAVRKQPFVALIGEAEDRREFKYAFDQNISLRSYVCSLPALGSGLWRITLDAQSVNSSSRKVWLRRFAEARIRSAVNREAREEIAGYFDTLRKEIEEVGSKLLDLGDLEKLRADLRELSVQTSKVGEAILAESKERSSVLPEDGQPREYKLDVAQVWQILAREVQAFSERPQNRGVSISYAQPDFAQFPRRARISPGIWRYAIRSILNEIARCMVHPEEPNVHPLTLAFLPPDQGAAASADRIVARFETERNRGLDDKAAVFRRPLKHSGNEVENGLRTSDTLLRSFDALLIPYPTKGRYRLEVGIRYLYSVEGAAEQ